MMSMKFIAPKSRVMHLSRSHGALDGLADCGVPADLIDAVRALVDAGSDEADACLLLLFVLLREGVKLTLGRDGSRRVRREGKALAAAQPDLAARIEALVAGRAGTAG